jgi:ADP-heptose:LPS heptosyltransferase
MVNSNLLIIHQGALGDVVLTFPALIALRQKFGRIDIISQGQLGKLAAKLGLVDKAYPLETAYFASLFSDEIDEKIKDLICNYKSILVFSFSSDLKNSIRQITDGQYFQIPPRPPVQEQIHVARFLFENLIDSGLLEDADSNEKRFTWQKRQAHWKVKPIDASKIIIHPGSGSIRKRWPLTNFLDLSDGLEKRGLQPQFVCGPAEPDLIEEIRKQDRQVHTFSKLTDLVDWFETAGGYIGNDSGVSQLAAFLGLPSVVIFGPADPARWKPLGPRVQIVQPELDCQPCFEIEPENCAQPECLVNATLESVLSAFNQLYKW